MTRASPSTLTLLTHAQRRLLLHLHTKNRTTDQEHLPTPSFASTSIGDRSKVAQGTLHWVNGPCSAVNVMRHLF